MRTEFDTAKRISATRTTCRSTSASSSTSIHALGSATGFNVAWPAVRNFGVFNGLQWGYLWKHFWIDETQAPFKKT